jgi:non-canonical purine NTP pyrophosphatase (RdgB/HAM1 family)
MTHTSIIFITGNAMKAKQLSDHLDTQISHQKIDLNEIQSLDLEEVVEHKAREAYKYVKSTVLVEDTSLTFTALGRLPGPLIKWFLTELKNDGLCKLLKGYEDRTVTARVVFGLYDGGETVEMFDGEAKGVVSLEPRGSEGFGWDPIFIPEGWDKTWGEMSPDEQSKTSMRRIALKKLQLYLESNG